MTPSEDCRELVAKFEGCKLAAYPDPGSGDVPWTIGYGATGPDIKKGVTWTQQQADTRLMADLTRFAKGVSTAIGAKPATQHQFDAMVSFAFNVGLTNLLNSTLLRLHVAGDYAGAANQFAKWNKAAGRVLAGLTRRRAAEAALYRGDA